MTKHNPPSVVYASTCDRRIIGNATPQFPYSFGIRADWNSIDISAFFQGIGQQDWYPNTDSRLFWAMYNRPYDSFIRKDLADNIWSEESPDAYFPRLRGYAALSSDGELGTVNDRYLQSISYLRLKNLSIGYTLPRQWVERISLEAANMSPDPFLLAQYVNVAGGNQGVILEIRRERRIELFMEGYRWDDLIRWKEGQKLV